MPDEDQPPLGCSKCRYSQRGCKRCKDPAFNSRKRGNLTSCSKSRAPKRQSRHHGQPISKASHGQTKQIGTQPGKAPGTVAVCSFSVYLFARYTLRQCTCTASSAARSARQTVSSQAHTACLVCAWCTKLPLCVSTAETAMDTKQGANHKLAVSTDHSLPLPQTQPKAPPPDSAATLADHQNASAEWGIRDPTMAPNAGQPARDCADVASVRQAAVHTEHDAQTSASKPRSIHADEEVTAAAAASPGVPYPEQDHSSHVAHTAAENQTFASDTDASQLMPVSSPATGPTSGVAASAPDTIKQAQPAASGADFAAAAGAHQPDATPSAAPQPDPQVGPSSQATASDSRPSFLSMLQSKMDKQRQQRRESQSAGSASESSLSSVHAAGANSMEKSGPSVDSGASFIMLIVLWPSIVAKHCGQALVFCGSLGLNCPNVVVCKQQILCCAV